MTKRKGRPLVGADQQNNYAKSILTTEQVRPQLVLSAGEERELLDFFLPAWDGRGSTDRRATEDLAGWFTLRQDLRRAERRERERTAHVARLVRIMRETDSSRTVVEALPHAA